MPRLGESSLAWARPFRSRSGSSKKQQQQPQVQSNWRTGPDPPDRQQQDYHQRRVAKQSKKAVEAGAAAAAEGDDDAALQWSAVVADCDMNIGLSTPASLREEISELSRSSEPHQSRRPSRENTNKRSESGGGGGGADDEGFDSDSLDEDASRFHGQDRLGGRGPPAAGSVNGARSDDPPPMRKSMAHAMAFAADTDDEDDAGDGGGGGGGGDGDGSGPDDNHKRGMEQDEEEFKEEEKRDGSDDEIMYEHREDLSERRRPRPRRGDEEEEKKEVKEANEPQSPRSNTGAFPRRLSRKRSVKNVAVPSSTRTNSSPSLPLSSSSTRAEALASATISGDGHAHGERGGSIVAPPVAVAEAVAEREEGIIQSEDDADMEACHETSGDSRREIGEREGFARQEEALRTAPPVPAAAEIRLDRNGDPANTSTSEMLRERIRMLEDKLQKAAVSPQFRSENLRLEKENAELKKRMEEVRAQLEEKAATAADELSLLNRRIHDLRKSHSENMVAAADEFASLTERVNRSDRESREVVKAHAKQLREKDSEIARLQQAVLDAKSQSDERSDPASSQAFEKRLRAKDEEIERLQSRLLLLHHKSLNNIKGSPNDHMGGSGDDDRATGSTNSVSSNGTSNDGVHVGIGGVMDACSMVVHDHTENDGEALAVDSPPPSSSPSSVGGYDRVEGSSSSYRSSNGGGTSWSRGDGKRGGLTGWRKTKGAGDRAGGGSRDRAGGGSWSAGDAHRGCLMVTCSGVPRREEAHHPRRPQRPSNEDPKETAATAAATALLAQAQGVTLEPSDVAPVAGRRGHKVQQTAAFWEVLSRTLTAGSDGAVASRPTTGGARAGGVGNAAFNSTGGRRSGIGGLPVPLPEAGELGAVRGDSVAADAAASVYPSAEMDASGEGQGQEGGAVLREEMATQAIEAAVKAEEIARNNREEVMLVLDAAQERVADAERRTMLALRKTEQEFAAASERANMREQAARKAEQAARAMEAEAREQRDRCQEILQGSAHSCRHGHGISPASAFGLQTSANKRPKGQESRACSGGRTSGVASLDHAPSRQVVAADGGGGGTRVNDSAG